MKTFEVLLTKSYILKIKEEDETSAKKMSEFFTSDIKDISTSTEKKIHKFKIGNIECKYNEAIETVEVNENN